MLYCFSAPRSKYIVLLPKIWAIKRNHVTTIHQGIFVPKSTLGTRLLTNVIGHALMAFQSMTPATAYWHNVQLGVFLVSRGWLGYVMRTLISGKYTCKILYFLRSTFELALWRLFCFFPRGQCLLYSKSRNGF